MKMAKTIVVEGANAAGIVEGVAQYYGNINRLVVTIDEDGTGRGTLRISVNGGARSVPAYGVIQESTADPVDRLREIADQYRTGNITTNPMDALREVVELLEPAYQQLLRS